MQNFICSVSSKYVMEGAAVLNPALSFYAVLSCNCQETVLHSFTDTDAYTDIETLTMTLKLELIN